jgi:hypothetical protein
LNLVAVEGVKDRVAPIGKVTERIKLMNAASMRRSLGMVLKCMVAVALKLLCRKGRRNESSRYARVAEDWLLDGSWWGLLKNRRR